MTPFYSELRNQLLEQPEENQESLRLLDCFSSASPEAQLILGWLQKQPGAMDDAYATTGPEDKPTPKVWESFLLSLLSVLTHFEGLSAWDRASADRRKAHAKKVERLARELADALEENIAPSYPPLPVFMNDACVGAFSWAFSADAEEFLANNHHAEWRRYRELQPIPEGNVGKVLVRHAMLAAPQQPMAPVLKRLASYAALLSAETASEPQPVKRGDRLDPIIDRFARQLGVQLEAKPDMRPNTGNPEARVLARRLADFFQRLFSRTPNEVIAACICLKYPEIDPPPTADTIRDWRGAK